MTTWSRRRSRDFNRTLAIRTARFRFKRQKVARLYLKIRRRPHPNPAAYTRHIRPRNLGCLDTVISGATPTDVGAVPLPAYHYYDRPLSRPVTNTVVKKNNYTLVNIAAYRARAPDARLGKKGAEKKVEKKGKKPSPPRLRKYLVSHI